MEQARFKRKTITLEVLETQQHKKKMRRIAFYIFLFSTVTLIFLAVAFAVFFRIRDINVEGNDRYAYEDILLALPVKANDNLYSFKTQDIENAIRKAFPYVENVTVTRKIPSRVTIKIEETAPAMYMEVAGDYYLLSSHLRVLDKLKYESDIPGGVIKLRTSRIERCIVGEVASFIDRRTYDALTELYKNISDNNIQSKIVYIDIVNRFEIYMNYEGRFNIYFGDLENSDIKVQFLCSIVGDRDVDARGKIDISDTKLGSFLPYESNSIQTR